MIDLKRLREDPDRFKAGARDKNIDVDIEHVLRLDERRRQLMTEQEVRRAEQKKISKVVGPQIGRLKGLLKTAEGAARDALETEIRDLESRPVTLKNEIQAFEHEITQITPELDALLLEVPQPPDDDVPRGRSADDNVQIRTWHPDGFDPTRPFEANRGFAPKTHLDLIADLGLVDFQRAVGMSGARHYVLVGDGMRLHQAVLRYAFDRMTNEHGFTPMSVPVIVREECMVGTGFFPAGRDQAYHIEESRRGSGHDLFLTGTGEVGLMGLHQDEILDAETLPRRYATVSTCFRREAGAAGKDTAGLYRIHQFDKVEQVVICRADEAESRAWHAKMIGFVEDLLQSLELPYRLLQCCTGDLGPKNADMVDIECWMPGRGDLDAAGRPTGAYGETHSASRLYDFQCRRLKMRYRDEHGNNVFCHSLNNTVIASPRILIPILEIHQQADGTVTIPPALRPHMGGRERIGG
ncbi:MAG: serine--tRNA ligase [Phycisphaerales bacterium]|nr:serine--tRNA ligase [Phycisphaerales bacterium]